VSTSIVLLLGGVLFTGYLVAALFFLRFWRGSRDRLFAIFAAAFVLLALQRLLLALELSLMEDAVWSYVIRLLAFLLILFAIVDKNRGSSRARG
jgi:peptidoglycan/LPS O-acetylase OafA/YrhL